MRTTLEAGYLRAETPWEQSGKSGPFEEWVRLRIPIAECVTKSGSFLDIGCANGFLLSCLLQWTSAKGIRIEPYGLDFSPRIATLARMQLPEHRDNLFVGNAWEWTPPQTFDFVRTEVVYVPPQLHQSFIRRLLDEFVSDGGALLVAHYRSQHEDLSAGWIDQYLRTLGFAVSSCTHGFDGEGRERTRIAVLRKDT